jgi:hypothetical protein
MPASCGCRSCGFSFSGRVADTPDFERDLALLESELRRLEAEYNMYFAGRSPRPPVESRRRVDQLVRRLDNTAITNYADRFRFSTLQARFVKFLDLWDRGLRAKEEGRPSPFVSGRSPRPPAQPPHDPTPAPRDPNAEQVLHIASFSDPAREPVKLRQLYDRLVEARKSVGEKTVPFEKFVHTVAEQVRDLKEQGVPEVAFRVGMKGGKVSLTAKGMRRNQS